MPNTIATLLFEAADLLNDTSETARLDAEVLLCHCLGQSRSFLRAWPEKQLNREKCEYYASLIAQRQHGVPVAYLTGYREFWSRDFIVNRDVLIPRPESELLIELCLKHILPEQRAKLIDLGTGSGILALSLAAERNRADVVGTDISQPALTVAIQNAARLNICNVRFMISDWFHAVPDREFDAVISNPPYLALNDAHLRNGDLRFEPVAALACDEHGLSHIRTIATQSCSRLKKEGCLFIEHGYDQSAEVREIFKSLGYHMVSTHDDLAGHPRVTSGIWTP